MQMISGQVLTALIEWVERMMPSQAELHFDYLELKSRPGFHLGFLSRGANMTIAELKGGKDYPC